MGAIREGRWRCKRCNRECRGSQESCDSCGWVRDNTVEFYLPEDAPVVTDEAQVARAHEGPDWACECCDDLNRASRSDCQGCGAPRGSKRARSGEVVPPIAAAQSANASAPTVPLEATSPVASVADSIASGPAYTTPTPEPVRATTVRSYDTERPTPAAPLATCGVVTGLVAAMALFVAFICFAFGSHDDKGCVTQLSWKRTIEVEALVPHHESEWEGAPAGAYDVTHRPEVKGYVQVQVGTHVVYKTERYRSGSEDYWDTERVQTGTKTVITGHKNLGNGHFEDITKQVPVYGTRQVRKTRAVYSTRQVPCDEPTYEDQPVYREKYYYTVNRWTHAREALATGNDSKPRWPDLTLATNEREESRAESYDVGFLLKSEPELRHLTPTSADEFMRYPIGSLWHVEWSRAGGVKVLGSNMPEAASAK